MAKAFAHDIAVANEDGKTIYYNYTNNGTELKVTYCGDSPAYFSDRYSGNVVIPETVTYEGKTYSVTSIGNSAFGRCTGLTELTIPNSVTEIEGFTFPGCTGLTVLTIADGTETLKFSTSSSSTPLSNIPIKTLYLGRNVDYSYQKSNYFGFDTYYNSPFKNNTSLETLTIGDSVTAIGISAFAECTGLTEVTIPNSVQSISDSAFSGCTGLTKLIIGNGVTSINASAFSGCSGLTELIIADGKNDINFYWNFSGCPIKTLYLGRNFSPNQSPFVNKTSLETLTIGKRVELIGASAFAGCTALTSVTSLKNIPPTIQSSTFDVVTENNAILHVPEGSKTIYLQSPYWEYFYRIQEDAVDGIEQVGADMEQGGEQGGKTGIYTLNGVKLSTTDPSTLPKGIYIIDGKKTTIK